MNLNTLDKPVSPFLKWAGGKRWLVSSGRLPVPDTFERYIEPFLGSGAIFFHLSPLDAILTDVNHSLICLYQVLRDTPLDLMRIMQTHQENHSREYYYEMRASNPSDRLGSAARTLYLNRTCWNGLYRVNMKGIFNVPIGTKSSVILPRDDFLSVSRVLQSANLQVADFEETIDGADAKDLLFVDPPYTVQHNFNGFVKYNDKIFSWQDQIRLKNAVLRAKQRGVHIVMTNADHQSVRALYEDILHYESLGRFSVIAGEKMKRVETSEALFRSF